MDRFWREAANFLDGVPPLQTMMGPLELKSAKSTIRPILVVPQA